MLKAVHVTDIIHVHSHNVHILTGNLVRGGWMLLEVNQRQIFPSENTVYIMFTVYDLLLNTFLGRLELSYINYVYIVQSHYILKGKHQGEYHTYGGPWKKRACRGPATITRLPSLFINQFFHNVKLLQPYDVCRHQPEPFYGPDCYICEH